MPRRLRKQRRKGIAPVVSTIMLTAGMMLGLILTLNFVHYNLVRRSAENDFNSAKIFMKTVGLQVDNVAWTTGRTETVQYTTQNGEISLVPATLNYTVQDEQNQTLAYYEVGVLFYNVPLSQYSLNNEYYEEILPVRADMTESFPLLLSGTKATVTRVFAIQKIPMYDGEYIRVVVAPVIRSLSFNISSQEQTTNYVKLYIANLTLGETPRVSQSITLSGKSVRVTTLSNINSIKVTVSFPKSSLGFDNNFFDFQLTQVIELPEETVVQLYISDVEVDLGI